MNAEQERLQKSGWKKRGPCLSERQWGTVREDYSEHGNTWDFFPHDHSFLGCFEVDNILDIPGRFF